MIVPIVSSLVAVTEIGNMPKINASVTKVHINFFIFGDDKRYTFKKDGYFKVLGRELKKVDSEVKVYKNTLVRRALDDKNVDLSSELEGQNAIIFGKEILEPIKALDEFAKKHDNVKVVAGLVEGEVVEQIASKEESTDKDGNVRKAKEAKILFKLANGQEGYLLQKDALGVNDEEDLFNQRQTFPLYRRTSARGCG